MKSLTLLFAVLGFMLVSGSAEAQVRWYRSGVWPNYTYTPYGYSYSPYGYSYSPYGYGWGWNYYGAAGYSPVEGYQRGLADVIRARGQAAEDLSRARINNEEARRRYLENKEKWTEIYWERKRLAEAELAREHAEDRARRNRWLEARRDREPETLPPSQFDPRTGEIQWPRALQSSRYAGYRAQIEAELQQQARTGTTSNAGRIRMLAREMQDLLKEEIHQMSPNEYLAAHKFLDRLVNQMALAGAS